MKSIAIIGGGAIGLCSAYYLVKNGYQVSIFEAKKIGQGCSYGNAGIIVPSHFETLSSPGILQKGLKWMLNPNSPFFLKPRFDFELLEWLVKFGSFCTSSHVEKNRNFIKELNLYSKDLYEQMQQEINFDYDRSGLLILCRSEKYLKEEEATVQEAKKLYLDADMLSLSEIKELEPNISFDALGGSYYRCDAKVQPYDFMMSLKNFLVDNGVTIYENVAIEDMQIENSQIKCIVDQNSDKYIFNQYIVSAGILTSKIMKKLKIKILMEGGKGFSFKVKKREALEFKTPIILAEEKVSVTPYGEYVRFGGTMMISGYDASLSQRRIQNIKKGAMKYIQNISLKSEDLYDVWAGLRPCGPDGLPYIGRLKAIKNTVVATGHAMMGISLAPATGKIVNDIISKEDTFINIERLDPQRFN